MFGPNAAPELDRVHRTLRYAVSQDGAHLWSLRYLEATCRPILQALLPQVSSDGEADALTAAVGLLEGVDALPWTRRLEPLREVLALVEGLCAAAPPAPLVAEPRLRLIEPEPEPEQPRSRPAPAAAATPPAPEPPPTPAPPPPPEVRRLPLGHEDGTGQDLSILPGATEALVAALDELGVTTIADLLTLIPVEQERLPVLEPGEAIDDSAEEVAVTGEVLARFTRMRPMGRVVEGVLRWGEGALRCRWIDALPEGLSLEAGATVTLAGRVELTDEGPVLYEALDWTPDSRNVVRRPVYGLEGVADEDLHRLLRLAVSRYAEALLDPVPANVLKDARVPGLSEALAELHRPTVGLKRPRSRFSFEELLVHQLRLAAAQPVRVRGHAHAISHELICRLQSEQQFVLNDAQEMVFDEIRRDLRRPVAMTRLLQGDVGAGKALVALLTAIVVAESKSQVLFLAPDPISAEHRFLFAEPLIRAAGLIPQLIVGEASAAQADALRRGEANIVFATHALAEPALPAFRKLGLVVVEERGPYGVMRRDALAQKNQHPDLLVVTAVPIPSSLTFTLFADHDISVIDGPAQQVVECQVRRVEQRADAYHRIIERLQDGQQALVVFPMVRGADLVDPGTAQKLAAALAAEAFPGYSVGVYHGATSREERARVFEDFERRRFQVLLATTSIEDAPELSNVTAILVENADRYDLVRLHRLRGMVAKGRRAGLCIYVLSEPASAEGTRLVELVAREQDGFSIAEQDRLVRGDDALLGGRAAELPEFRVAEPAKERDLLMRARRAALNLLAEDPKLRQRQNRWLGQLVIGEDEESGDGQGRGKAGTRSRRRRRRRKGGKP